MSLHSIPPIPATIRLILSRTRRNQILITMTPIYPGFGGSSGLQADEVTFHGDQVAFRPGEPQKTQSNRGFVTTARLQPSHRMLKVSRLASKLALLQTNI